MRDTLAGGRVFRTLKIVDDYARVLGHRGRYIVTEDAGGAGTGMALGRSTSWLIIGPISPDRTVNKCAARSDINLRFINPGKPMKNAYSESFNRKSRDECLSSPASEKRGA